MIIHVDMDAFFASVEQRDQPQLKGKAVAVGGSASGRGVVAAASYEARKFGVHSAMSGVAAARLCPQLIFVRSDLRKYSEVGRQVREIFNRYTPIIQPLSLDEAFLDVRPTVKIFGSAEAIGRWIQADILRELHLPCSVGIAPRKFIAKIASDLQKPQGFVSVAEESIREFLDPLPISRLWGVGKVTHQKLAKYGIKTIADVRHFGEANCQRQLGQLGDHLWRLANGEDPRQVITDHKAKSIGHERTFHQDISDDDFLRSALHFLAEQVARRLRAAERLARQVSIKYRLHDFRTFTRNQQLKTPSDSTELVANTAIELLTQIRHSHQSPVRLVGVSLGNLTPVNYRRQLSLFEEEKDQRQATVDRIGDQLSRKFGESALYRAAGHQWIERKSQNSLDSPNRSDLNRPE